MLNVWMYVHICLKKNSFYCADDWEFSKHLICGNYVPEVKKQQRNLVDNLNRYMIV